MFSIILWSWASTSSAVQTRRSEFWAISSAETPTPPWLAWTGLERVETVPAMAPGKSAFLVTGDPSRNKELCLPGGGFATVRIRLPKAWDTLMAERGYPPLETFFVR